jgi:hypothetical protein
MHENNAADFKMLKCAVVMWCCYLAAPSLIGSIALAPVLIAGCIALMLFGVAWLPTATRFLAVLGAVGCMLAGVSVGCVAIAATIKILIVG